jgi:hypothetical protein
LIVRPDTVAEVGVGGPESRRNSHSLVPSGTSETSKVSSALTSLTWSVVGENVLTAEKITNVWVGRRTSKRNNARRTRAGSGVKDGIRAR